MLRVYFQIFKKLYHFTNIYLYIYIYIYIYTVYRPSIISLASKLKNVLASGDSIAKVSVEGCNVIFFFFFEWTTKPTLGFH